MIDINSLALEISQSMAEKVLTKSLPPRVANRLRAWAQASAPRFTQRPHLVSYATTLIQEKIEELALQKALKKNEAVASVYKNGVVRMDFGAEVPERVKKAAMLWAKKRGLQAVEASFQKSSTATPSYVVFSRDQRSRGVDCTERLKWELTVG